MIQESASRKKVLILSTNADWAGAPIHVMTLARALAPQFELSLVFGADGPVRQALLAEGFACTVLPTLRSSIHPLRDLHCLFAFVQILRTVRPDLVHAHSSKAGMAARVASWMLRIPCVFTVHGWGFGPGRPRFQSLVARLLERLLARLPRVSYVFVSNADQLIGETQLGLPSSRCHTIHNGVPDHGCRADVATNASAIMVARVCHAKNHELLLDAVAASRSDFKLLLAGEGTMTPSFQAMVQTHAPNARGRVVCLGVSDRVPTLLASVGMFVLCSRYEGLPLSIIEALCAGLPVVATDVGGVRELVEDGVNGFLVSVDNPTDLARCLDRLANDPVLRVQMGKASRNRYETHFTTSRMVTAVAKLYCAVLGTVQG